MVKRFRDLNLATLVMYGAVYGESDNPPSAQNLKGCTTPAEGTSSAFPRLSYF